MKGGRWANRGGQGRAGTTLARGFEWRSWLPRADRRGCRETTGGAARVLERDEGERVPVWRVRAGLDREVKEWEAEQCGDADKRDR